MMEGCGNDITTRHPRFNVIPAKAGIQGFVPWLWMDSRLHGNDRGCGDPGACAMVMDGFPSPPARGGALKKARE